MKVAQLCPILCDPMGLWSMEFSRPEYWSGSPFPSPGYLPNPGIEPRSTALADSLPAESQGKPKNTGVGSLSLRQGIFLTQELNRGLGHCRRILYHLSYQGRESRGEDQLIKGFPGVASGKESACQCRRLKRRGFDPGVRKIPWSRNWQPTAVFFPGEFHGQRSLLGLQSVGSQRGRHN